MKRVLTAILTALSLCPIRVKGLSQLRKVASPNSLRSRPRTCAHWLASALSTPGTLGLSSTMARASLLDPGETSGFPAARFSAMAFGIRITLESFGDVVAFRIAQRGHRHGRGPAASSAATEEQDRYVVIGNLLAERGAEIRVDLHGRKILPGLQQRFLAKGAEIGQADEHPLGPRAHVDELRLLIVGKELPGIGRFQFARIRHACLDPSNHAPRNHPVQLGAISPRTDE